jgi:hypothetical protein
VPTTAQFQIGDTTYTLTSPLVRDLEHFEAAIGPLTDRIDTIKGRVYLLFLCLKPAHPDITPGVIGGWSWADYAKAWNAALTVFPFGQSESPDSSASSTPSSPAPTSGALVN